MQILKGKHKCFFIACVLSSMKQCKCCKFAKYYFFSLLLRPEKVLLEHASTNYLISIRPQLPFLHKEIKIVLTS